MKLETNFKKIIQTQRVRSYEIPFCDELPSISTGDSFCHSLYRFTNVH